MRMAIAVACAAWLAAEPARNPAGVAADLLQELVRQSPFVPAGGAAGRGDAARGELELRGVVWDGGSLRFSIFDPGTGESTWTTLDEEGLPFRARSYDREKDTLTVEYQGRVLVLPLAEAQFSESADGSPPPAPPLPTNTPGPGGPEAGAPVPAAGASSGAPMPAGAQDAQRLQQMADDMRRRRGVGPPPEPSKN